MKVGAKMEKGQLWTIVGVALVVAVVASIATASITGNVIKQNNYVYGKYQLYTTAEIDAKLKNVTTNQGVLDMLNKCQVVSKLESQQSPSPTCDDTCKGYGK